MPKRLTILDFINKSNTIHNNKYNYDKSKYINAHTKLTIMCPIHGEFLQTPNSHLNGCGCKECGIISLSINRRNNKENVIKKFIKVHNNKYNYSKFEYINDRTKSIIICSIHGEFLQCSHDHRKGIGCPKCGIKNRSSKRKLSIKDFIQKSNKTHNNKYDYSKFNYINNSTNGTIICPIHGEFLQSPNPHMRGNGCPKCNIKSKRINQHKTNKKVEFICKTHGSFWMLPSNYKQGQRCPKCKCQNTHDPKGSVLVRP